MIFENGHRIAICLQISTIRLQKTFIFARMKLYSVCKKTINVENQNLLHPYCVSLKLCDSEEGCSDFQQFAPFRAGVNKLLKIEFMSFLADTI